MGALSPMKLALQLTLLFAAITSTGNLLLKNLPNRILAEVSAVRATPRATR